MTPTDELRSKLRLLIDEQIPTNGTDTDTRFTDEELDEIMSEAVDIYAAASEAWFRKAARAMSERGGLEESSAGDERLKFISLQEYENHCLRMADMFNKRSRIGSRSRAMSLDAPDVLGTGDV
jgi:hypothetical protein